MAMYKKSLRPFDFFTLYFQMVVCSHPLFNGKQFIIIINIYL